jgi:Tat protein secretion system quality control protein TatD with DNase activity
VQHLAALRGMEVAEVAASTTANALKLFGLAPAD